MHACCMHGKLYKVGSTMSNNNDLPWLGGGGGEVVMVLAQQLVTLASRSAHPHDLTSIN